MAVPGCLGDKVNNNNDKLWTLSTLQGSGSSATGLFGLDVIVDIKTYLKSLDNWNHHQCPRIEFDIAFAK